MRKKFRGKSLVLLLTLSTMLTSQAALANATTNSSVYTQSYQQGQVINITDESEIEKYIEEKGLTVTDGEVVEVIKVTFPEEPPKISPQLIIREYYSKYISSGSSTESSPTINYSHPAGTIKFSEKYNSSWTVSASGGLKTDVIEAGLGYSVTESKERTYEWTSQKYTYAVNVKGYLNYNYKTHEIYDRDLVYDDYVGRVTTKQYTGYDIVVTKK